MHGQVEQWVLALQSGDPDAHVALVREFQDYAVACALGYGGQLEAARDAAQQVLVELPATVLQLRNPKSFPSWLRLVVRTAVSRQRRAERGDAGLLDEPEAASADDPADVVVARGEAERLVAAVATLPEHERLVISLQYLAALPQSEVAAFLDVPISTVKKRAHDARKRLRQIMDGPVDVIHSVRPFTTTRFSLVVQLFAAIRRGAADEVQRLVTTAPELLTAQESWTLDDALALGLPPARKGTPLLRAAELGHVDVLDRLLSAGAVVNDTCGCATGESPLWAAVQSGHTSAVGRLLAAGANPNAAPASGVTPLMVAAMRERRDVEELLLAAGANRERVDINGRGVEDWRPVARPALQALPRLSTGIAAIDLLAPLRVGDVLRVASAFGVGLTVLLAELAVRVVPPDGRTLWVLGPSRPFPRPAVTNALAEAGLAPSAQILAADPQVEGAVRRAVSAGATYVVLMHGTAHQPHLDALLPLLRHQDGLQLTVVVGPDRPVPQVRAARSRLEGCDAHLTFDPRRAARNLWPALDLVTTQSRAHPAAGDLADRVREILVAYDELDPELDLPDPTSFASDQRLLVAAAQDVHRAFAQPFLTAQPFTAAPAHQTSVEDIARAVNDVLNSCRSGHASSA